MSRARGLASCSAWKDKRTIGATLHKYARNATWTCLGLRMNAQPCAACPRCHFASTGVRPSASAQRGLFGERVTP